MDRPRDAAHRSLSWPSPPAASISNFELQISSFDFLIFPLSMQEKGYPSTSPNSSLVNAEITSQQLIDFSSPRSYRELRRATLRDTHRPHALIPQLPLR